MQESDDPIHTYIVHRFWDAKPFLLRNQNVDCHRTWKIRIKWNNFQMICPCIIHSNSEVVSDEITYLVVNLDDSSISNTFKLYVSPQTDKRFVLLLENSSFVIWFLIGWWTWTFSLVFLMSYKWTWPDWFPTTMLNSLLGNHLTHVGQLELSL